MVAAFSVFGDAYPSDAAVLAALRSLGVAEAGDWAAPIGAACRANGIDTAARLAMFLANASVETGRFKRLTENLNYARDALPKVFGSGRGLRAASLGLGRPPGSKVPLTPEQQLRIADVVYGGTWGLKNLGNRLGTTDARDYIGRGIKQLTGYANNKRFADEIGVAVEALPALLVTREGAAESGARFWRARGINRCADCGDVAEGRRLVNGGDLGLAEVAAGNAAALQALRAVA